MNPVTWAKTEIPILESEPVATVHALAAAAALIAGAFDGHFTYSAIAAVYLAIQGLGLRGVVMPAFPIKPGEPLDPATTAQILGGMGAGTAPVIKVPDFAVEPAPPITPVVGVVDPAAGLPEAPPVP